MGGNVIQLNVELFQFIIALSVFVAGIAHSFKLPDPVWELNKVL